MLAREARSLVVGDRVEWGRGGESGTVTEVGPTTLSITWDDGLTALLDIAKEVGLLRPATADIHRLDRLCQHTRSPTVLSALHACRPTVLNALHACRPGHPLGHRDKFKWRSAHFLVAQHVGDFMSADQADLEWLAARNRKEAELFP